MTSIRVLLTDDVSPFSSVSSVLPVQLLFISPSFALSTHPARLNTDHVSVFDKKTLLPPLLQTLLPLSRALNLTRFSHHLAFASPSLLRLDLQASSDVHPSSPPHHYKPPSSSVTPSTAFSVSQAELGNAAVTVGNLGLKLSLRARSYMFYMGVSYKNNVNTYLHPMGANQCLEGSIFKPSVWYLYNQLASPLGLA